MSDFRIDKITNRDGSAGTQIAGISTFSGTSGMVIPGGPTEYRGGRGRAVRAGGRISPAQRPEMDYVEIATIGNATDFGDLSLGSAYNSSVSSTTRGVVALAGAPSSGSYSSKLDHYTFSSQGDANNFGDLTSGRIMGKFASSDGTRGVFAAGRNAPSGDNNIDTIDYVTIANAGDAVDFGNLDKKRTSGCGGNVNSTTRGVWAGGYTDPTWTSQYKDIQYITIQTKGDSKDFGELFTGTYRWAGCSSTTRGLFMGGNTGGPSTTQLNTIQYVTIATLGNTTDFGDLTRLTAGNASASSPTRGLAMGGWGPSLVNTIDYVTISTTGNAIDFGDSTQVLSDHCASSDVHGGLG